MTKRKEHSPSVVVDSGASYEEPIPFAGIVEIEPEFDYDDDPIDLDSVCNFRTNHNDEN
jgi:hypothetical protein